MDIETKKAYVYQPDPPRPDGKFYGVGGLTSFGIDYDESVVKGVDKQTAEEIVRLCNDHPDFAKSLVSGIKSQLDI